ncbi:carboxyl transferase domain-containing protein [Sorangium sp. So ce124]|uniref:carboxyl transferase domain-containing protein n=1 Tax=Sorangium sp. So ce124 TaxID=3133280 RepID=UPI003F5F0A53
MAAPTTPQTSGARLSRLHEPPRARRGAGLHRDRRLALRRVRIEDLPGDGPRDEDRRPIIAHGAKLLYAFARATVPKVTGITRKAYGGAYDVRAPSTSGPDYNLASPAAEIALMGPESAVSIVYRGELQRAADPAAGRACFADDDKAKFANPYKTAELGFSAS